MSLLTIEIEEYARDYEEIEEALDAPDLEEEELILLDDELYVSENESDDE